MYKKAILGKIIFQVALLKKNAKCELVIGVAVISLSNVYISKYICRCVSRQFLAFGDRNRVARSD